MRWSVAIVFALTVLASPAAAQTAATPPQRDVIAELLEEVRGLRQAMERAATVGARIQLLVARVQLQEQRIQELSRRLVAVRAEMTTLDSQSSGVVMNLTMFEKSRNDIPAGEREQMEQMVEAWKRQIAGFDKRKLDLANEEALLTQQISADQNRWSDVNGQLDDIERSLTMPVKK